MGGVDSAIFDVVPAPRVTFGTEALMCLGSDLRRDACAGAPAQPLRSSLCRVYVGSALASETLDGITAFYSIIHIPRQQVVKCVERCEESQTWRMSSHYFHLGTEDTHHDELFGGQ